MSKHAIFGDVISDHPMRENIISKMSNSLKVRYDKMSTTERKTIYGRSAEKNGMYGRVHSRETKEKISQMKTIYLRMKNIKIDLVLLKMYLCLNVLIC